VKWRAYLFTKVEDKASLNIVEVEINQGLGLGADHLTCHYFKKPWHFIATCPKLEDRRKDLKQASAFNTKKSDIESDTDVFTASSSSRKSNL